MEDLVVDLKNTSDFDNFLKNSNLPVIVDFYADWCGPCKKLTPIILEKANTTKKFRLLKVNVDDHPEIAEKYDVGGIPHVILFKKHVSVFTFVGNDMASLDKMIELIK